MQAGLAPSLLKLSSLFTLLLQENLHRRRWHLSSRCFLCKADPENNSYLFLHFGVTAQLWQLFLTLGKKKRVMPGNTYELLSCWNYAGNNTSNKRWWKVIPAAIWWTVWRGRDARCFEGKSNTAKT